MKMPAVAAVAVLGVALSGCATVLMGTTQTVSVSSPPVRGARCVVFGEDMYRDLVTPGSVRVPRSREDLTVICTKRGFKEAKAVVASHFNFVTAGNAVAGGLTGIIVDASTGANDSYPGEIEVPMGRAPRPTMFHDATIAPTS
ncbi:MAG: hypothetical protein JO056_03880 [Alphaproteobacteria bacterium]|nr:hypothetical protein [Alphaproteobacteria bacterium]